MNICSIITATKQGNTNNYDLIAVEKTGKKIAGNLIPSKCTLYTI